ncbi:MAG: hypothetical protein ACP5HK_06155 [Acidilobus sp.]
MVRVRVSWFTRREVVIGPVELEALVPVQAEEVEMQGRALDAIISAAEQATRSRRGDFAVLESEGGETRYVLGEGIKDRTGTRLLYPIPSRLVRVGVVRLGQLSQALREGAASFNLGSVEWYDAPPGTYVYDGPLKAEEDVEYVLFHLENGDIRVIRAPRLSRLLLSVTPPTERGQGSPAGEPSAGEGSSPSE